MVSLAVLQHHMNHQRGLSRDVDVVLVMAASFSKHFTEFIIQQHRHGPTTLSARTDIMPGSFNAAPLHRYFASGLGS